MRDRLRSRQGKVAVYRAVFACYRQTRRTDYRPVRLTMGFFDVTGGKGMLLCDHLWFIDEHGFDHLKLIGGETVEFYASVREYRRNDGSTDYQLANVMFAKVVR